MKNTNYKWNKTKEYNKYLGLFAIFRDNSMSYGVNLLRIGGLHLPFILSLYKQLTEC